MPVTANAELKLEFHYSGLDVDRGRMDATVLGPAIFGIGKALGATSRVLYGDDTRLRVEVKADFEHASFGLEVYAVAVGGELIAFLSRDDLTNILANLGLLSAAGFGAVKGVIWLIKRQRGRKVTAAERVGDTMNVTFEGDDTVNITINEYKVFVDPEVRNALRSMVAPLSREGVETLAIRANNSGDVVVEKAETFSFDAPATPDEEISIDPSRAVLEVIAPVFRDGHSWKFAQGNNVIWAKVDDGEFLAQVARHRTTFGKGDALVVELETRTVRKDGEFHFERRVTKVIEHIPGSEGDQLALV